MSIERPQPPIHESHKPYEALVDRINTLSEVAEELYPGLRSSFMAASHHEGQIVFDVVGQSNGDPARLVMMGRRHDLSSWRYVNVLARPDGIRVATAQQRTRSGTYPYMPEGRLLIDPRKAGIPVQFFRKTTQEALAQRVSHVADLSARYLEARTPEAEREMVVESRRLIGRAHDLAEVTPHLRVI